MAGDKWDPYGGLVERDGEPVMTQAQAAALEDSRYLHEWLKGKKLETTQLKAAVDALVAEQRASIARSEERLDLLYKKVEAMPEGPLRAMATAEAASARENLRHVKALVESSAAEAAEITSDLLAIELD